MYFKVSMRHNPKKDFTDGYYRLVESYRNSAGRVCHRHLLHVGFIEEHLTIDQLNQVQRILNSRVDSLGMGELFDAPVIEDAKVAQYADELFNRLVSEKRIDLPEDIAKREERERKQREREEKRGIHRVLVDTIENRDVKEIGGENVCYQALRQLKLDSFLLNKGWGADEVNLAMTQIIARSVYPASEFETVRWIQENSAVCELTGYEVEKLTKDKLYGLSKRLYAIKDEIEQHLSHKTNTLFDLKDKILIYDLTNTYFEGVMDSSQVAKYGRSKEKRSDCKLIVLALVINQEGFIKFSSIFEGNMSDAKSLEQIIDQIRQNVCIESVKPLVVLDAGIATEENLQLIVNKGYDYLCVTRSNRIKYTVEADNAVSTVLDKNNQPITLSRVKVGESTDYYLKVHSNGKERKERSINKQFADRFEAELTKIAASITKKGGLKLLDKVYERLGRVKQKYPSVHRYYDIDITSNKDGKANPKATAITWRRKSDIEIDERSGIYFLRTSLEVADEELIWICYNTIREVESSFRTLKTDLDLRPIYHKNDDSSIAHLHLGLLAYWVVNTVRHQLKQKGIKHQWKEVIRIMKTQKVVTTTAQNDQDHIIIIRQCTQPTAKAKQIYEALNYKSQPFTKRKFVVHKTKFRDTYLTVQQKFRSD